LLVLVSFGELPGGGRSARSRGARAVHGGNRLPAVRQGTDGGDQGREEGQGKEMKEGWSLGRMGDGLQ